MKIHAGDCLHILRKFKITTDEKVPRDISRLHVSNPKPTNTLVEFRFESAQYVLLFDDTAEDDQDYILEQVAISLPGRNASLIQNPQSSQATYALPFEGKSVYLLRIDADKQRLDSRLAQENTALSRSSWQKHVKAGHVTVDGKVQTSPKFTVDDTSDITVDLPEAPDHDDQKLPIIYIDDDVIVVDKPQGILTHTKNQLDHEFTVADFFRRYTTHDTDGDRPGIVHRLDRDTSGIIIGARHQSAYEHLKSQFADRIAKKTYTAVVQGAPNQNDLHIDLPIARNTTKPGSFTVKRDGKSAQTDVTMLKRGEQYSMLQLRPRTGRTHQLRVHLASLNLPILGDRLYGKSAERLYLHATELKIELPSGEMKTFKSDVPGEFYQAVDRIK